MAGEEVKEAEEAQNRSDRPAEGGNRPQRGTAGHVDDLADFVPSESEESEEEEEDVDTEELARELAALEGESEFLSGAPQGFVAHPDCGKLYDSNKYELRAFAPGKQRSFFWRYVVCFKLFLGKVRCLLCGSGNRDVIGLGKKFQTGNLLRHFEAYHLDEWNEYMQQAATSQPQKEQANSGTVNK